MLRPNNTIICPIVERSSRLTFVTLGGGGMLVVDSSRDGVVPPIVAEYDQQTVHGHGCGGMQSEARQSEDDIYFNAGCTTVGGSPLVGERADPHGIGVLELP